jgi:uncharacterized protein (DUF983 family)
MTDSTIMQRLCNTTKCCATCGEQYGTPKDGASGITWHGVCDICGLEMAVTDSQDWLIGMVRRTDSDSV